MDQPAIVTPGHEQSVKWSTWAIERAPTGLGCGSTNRPPSLVLPPTKSRIDQDVCARVDRSDGGYDHPDAPAPGAGRMSRTVSPSFILGSTHCGTVAHLSSQTRRRVSCSADPRRRGKAGRSGPRAWSDASVPAKSTGCSLAVTTGQQSGPMLMGDHQRTDRDPSDECPERAVSIRLTVDATASRVRTNTGCPAPGLRGRPVSARGQPSAPPEFTAAT